MSAAVVALKAVAGLAAWVRQGNEGNGCVVVRTGRLFVEEMHFRHEGDRAHIPRGQMFLLADDLLDGVTTFADGFV